MFASLGECPTKAHPKRRFVPGPRGGSAESDQSAPVKRPGACRVRALAGHATARTVHVLMCPVCVLAIVPALSSFHVGLSVSTAQDPTDCPSLRLGKKQCVGPLLKVVNAISGAGG